MMQQREAPHHRHQRVFITRQGTPKLPSRAQIPFAVSRLSAPTITMAMGLLPRDRLRLRITMGSLAESTCGALTFSRLYIANACP